MSRVQFVTGTLPISAKQGTVKQNNLLKQLSEFGQWTVADSKYQSRQNNSKIF